MKLRLPLVALAISGNAIADPVVVVDGATMQPIDGAIVHVGSRDMPASQADVDVGVEITVTAPGYDPVTQAAGEMIVLFKPGEVIEVKAQAPRDDAGYSLTRDEITHLPGGSTDALAAVRSLPGVGTGGAVSAGRLVIRGGAPQDSLLTVDGVPVPFIYHAFDNTTILPVSMIGAISYAPGGFGVDEGRATSGAVALATNDEQVTHGSASVSMLDASAAGAVVLGHGFTLSGGVRRSTVDLLIPIAVPASEMIGFTEPPRYYDGQLRLDWVRGHDRVMLLGLTSFDQLGIVNHMTDSDLPPDFDQHMSFGRAIASWKHEDGPLKNRLVAALGDGELHAKFDTIQHVDDRSALALIRDDVSVALGSSPLHVRGGAFAEIQHHDLDARSIIVPTDGLPSGHFGDLPIYTIQQPYDANYAAAYAAADATLGATTLTAGVRLDYFGHVHAAVPEPRVELTHKLADVTLHAAAGIYARDLDQAEGIPTNLLPEKATQVSTGADVDLGDGLTATASFYHTTRSDLAVDDPQVMPLPYASLGSGWTTGADLMLRLHRDHVFGWLAYSYGKTRRRDLTGTHPTAFDQTHTLTAVGSYAAGAWSFGGRFQLATGLPYTDVVGGMYSPELDRYLPVLGAPYAVRYPQTAQLDVRLERTWQTKRVRLAAFVDVTNVFRDARVQRYTYSDDFSSKKPLTEYIPLPSIGVRGEI